LFSSRNSLGSTVHQASIVVDKGASAAENGYAAPCTEQMIFNRHPPFLEYPMELSTHYLAGVVIALVRAFDLTRDRVRRTGARDRGGVGVAGVELSHRGC
jgi:hypothetical protein